MRDRSMFTARDRRSRGKVPASASKSSFQHAKGGAEIVIVGVADGEHDFGIDLLAPGAQPEPRTVQA